MDQLKHKVPTSDNCPHFLWTKENILRSVLGQGCVYMCTCVLVGEEAAVWLAGGCCPALIPSSLTPPAGSVHATSVAASRVEQALSEVASSLQSSAPKQGPLHPWMTLAQIWLHAGTSPFPDPALAPNLLTTLPQAAGSCHHLLINPGPTVGISHWVCSHTPTR